MPCLPVGDDLREVTAAIRGSLAPKTWACYAAAWSSWLSFTSMEGYQASGHSEGAILAFLASLMRQHFSHSHVTKVLAGISFYFRLLGLKPCSDYFSVRQALKGYRRGNCSKDERRPISLDILSGLCRATSAVCFSDYEALLFRTAFALAYFGAFRISELIPANKKGVSGIRLEHVVLDRERVHIWLSCSKTDQGGRGRWVELKVQDGLATCPVALVKQFLGVRPPGGGNFLTHLDLLPLTKYQFDAVLKRSLGIMGLAAYKFSSHSFRIGAASEAARAGVPEGDIKALGRWKSNCYQVYVRPNLFI